jgi:hypothetical protein
MWPDHGRLISHEFPPPPCSFLGKHYAVTVDLSGSHGRGHRAGSRPDTSFRAETRGLFSGRAVRPFFWRTAFVTLTDWEGVFHHETTCLADLSRFGARPRSHGAGMDMERS